jgi:pantoate--beta-alanine ligase
MRKLEEIGGVDAVFLPGIKDMYPSGIVQDLDQQRGTFVEVKGYGSEMEGLSRPSFFRGVATVVTKLFNAIEVFPRSS